MAQTRIGAGMIWEAGIVTIGLFLGITAVGFLTRADFSFLSQMLLIGAFLLLGFVIAGLVFGFWLRSFFAFALVALAGGWMRLNTSNLLHRYQTDQHILASISLFSSFLTLFWAIVRAYSYSSKLLKPNGETRA